MKKLSRKIRNLTVTIGTVAFMALFVASAYAATLSILDSYRKPADGFSKDYVVSSNPTDLSIKKAPYARAVAPEPSTLLLFGSGLFGMIVSFVRKTYAATKRVLDIMAGILGLVLLSPLFLITALIIKLGSKGPIFYKQIRVGKDGKAFWIYKFRTMVVDAEKGTGPIWASENDNRYIPCAKLLRKAHIDEIPQFLNILKGDMSLIGPRPERPVFVEKFREEIADYEKRLSVKPGLTGLAQVWHNYDETIEDVKKKIKYDILYIKKMCLLTDIRIVFRTFRVVLTGEGAR